MYLSSDAPQNMDDWSVMVHKTVHSQNTNVRSMKYVVEATDTSWVLYLTLVRTRFALCRT